MSRFFTVPAPNVVSESIAGELIVLDLVAGSYHATDGIGAALWELAVAGLDEDRIVAELSARWPDELVSETARGFLQRLVDTGLLVAADGNSGSPVDSASILDGVAWSTPTLSSYDDLADMIQLDPIHDVSDSGWPTANSHPR